MTREIKFRAFDKDQGKLVKIYEVSWYLGELHKINGERDAYDLMQYTGLKDKNGVEIYEGDLTHAKGSKTVFRIEFYNGGFFFVPHHTHEPDLWKMPSGKTGIMPMYLLMEKGGIGGVEVIGNIMENPELLK